MPACPCQCCPLKRCPANSSSPPHTHKIILEGGDEKNTLQKKRGIQQSSGGSSRAQELCAVGSSAKTLFQGAGRGEGCFSSTPWPPWVTPACGVEPLCHEIWEDHLSLLLFAEFCVFRKLSHLFCWTFLAPPVGKCSLRTSLFCSAQAAPEMVWRDKNN